MQLKCVTASLLSRGRLSQTPLKFRQWWSGPQATLALPWFYQLLPTMYLCRVAAPKLTSTSSSFTWIPEALAAFSHLEQIFTSAHVLSFPDPSRQFIVEVDGSISRVRVHFFHWAYGDHKLHLCAFFLPSPLHQY